MTKKKQDVFAALDKLIDTVLAYKPKKKKAKAKKKRPAAKRKKPN